MRRFSLAFFLLAAVAHAQTASMRLPGSRAPSVRKSIGKEVRLTQLRINPESTPALGDSLHLNASSNLYYRSRLEPQQSGFDALQFLTRVDLKWAHQHLGAVRVLLADRWNLAQGMSPIGSTLDRRENPVHTPLIQRLFYEWRQNTFGLGVKVGRQRLSQNGRRSAGSASWLGDWQVFDAARIDLGKADATGLYSYAYLTGSSWVSPWFFPGVPTEERPMHWVGAAWQRPFLGKLSTHAYLPESAGTAHAPVYAFSWESPTRKKATESTRVGADLLLQDPQSGDDAPAWHASVHRDHGPLTMRAGMERLRGTGRRVSASNITFRYLSRGSLTEANNVFLGAEQRLADGWKSALLVQHAWKSDKTKAPLGQAAQLSLRHRLAPGNSLTLVGGLGHAEEDGSFFVRSSMQWTKMF